VKPIRSILQVPSRVALGAAALLLACFLAACGRKSPEPAPAGTSESGSVATVHASQGVEPGKPMSLREAYPDYRPGAGDPEAEAAARGRREVPVSDRSFDIGGAPGLSELVNLVVSGIDQADGPLLERTAITRNDFESILWPEFPQSRPAAGVPAAEAWDFVHRQHVASFNRTSGELRGRGLRVASFKVGKTVPYTNFTLHDDVSVTLVDAAGTAIPFDMIRTVVECHGRFKLYATRD
jgi:hypothetical protein